MFTAIARPATALIRVSLGEMFKMMAGINMVHVPYRGAALALTDLTGR
jgi:tripartite-type tricarboxylate transporter receptor subunit TctC